MKNPKTPEEWQEAVDAAEFFLLLLSARAYGLIQTGARINPDRANELLKLGKQKGFVPANAAELCRRFLQPAPTGQPQPAMKKYNFPP